mgnify:FL=1
MARRIKSRPTKKAIYVFWEGESEEAYTKYLKNLFSAKSTIRIHSEKGTFSTAKAFFRGNIRFKNDVSELDEIWFFFDTEVDKGDQWDESMRCLEDIIRSRRKKPIKIRLLMTTGCIEYWLLLHYERVAPRIVTPADKDRVKGRVKNHVPLYEKGDYDSISVIASKYQTAVENGKWSLTRLNQDGMPQRTKENTMESDKWLFKGTHTFSTVHEAIEMLCALPEF